MSDQVQIIALSRAKPERVQETHELFMSILDRTLKEPGCITYRINVDRNAPTDFWFVETWESREAFDRHMATPELQQLLVDLKPLLAQDPTLWDVKLLP